MTELTEKPALQYQKAIAVMQPAIDKLLERYRGFAEINAVEHDQDLPERQIQDYLNQIDQYFPGAGKRKLKLAIRTFLTSLACFRYRVIAKTGIHSEAWNPLEQPLKQFLTCHRNADIIYRLDPNPFPSADLISDWITGQLKENIYQD